MKLFIQLCLYWLVPLAIAAESRDTLQKILSYPFPHELTAARSADRIAWVFYQSGVRNVWVAEGPEFRARRLTSYATDDGQEFTSLSLDADGRYLVYVRGGEHGSNWDRSVAVNPAAHPDGGKVEIWSVPFAGGEPKRLAEGDYPTISPSGDLVAFERERTVWIVPIDGSQPARRLFAVRGENGSPVWSPDGRKIAFVSSRGDHSFIGVYDREHNLIHWIAPSTGFDSSPRWSPDGRHIAFLRRPGSSRLADPLLIPRPAPWSIWTADVETGQARLLWKSGAQLRDSFPAAIHGGANLHWAASGRIVFLSYHSGWPSLYSIPQEGGHPLALTPGAFMVEHIRLSPDARFILAAANTGPNSMDIDRRHILRVPVDRSVPEVLTPGSGLEWSPVVTGGGAIVFLGATAQRPPLPMLWRAKASPQTLAEETLPADFPIHHLVEPKQVIFRAPDGVSIHAQLFENAGGPGKKPAVVYIHGGPMRQMLLGWHYSDYYARAYALNQYLARRGYVVLSVNYRLGIGYGYEFQHPPDGGARGASEYQDIKAAAEYLRTLPQVDPARIGVWGGSYGGYLTAIALARNSDLFAAGVDIHGVHDRANDLARNLLEPAYEKPPDLDQALRIAWESSPVASIASWKSPVLLIHGDDDRNVRFSQTVDLVQRLSRAGVSFEELVIPDDTHHFLRHANWMRVAAATAAFLDRHLQPQKKN